MSSFSSLIFARPKALGSTSRTVLIRFFEPHWEFLSERGVDFNDLADPENTSALTILIQILLSPSEKTPRQLIDAIFCVSELATSEATAALEEAAAAAGLTNSGRLHRGRSGDAALRRGSRGGQTGPCRTHPATRPGF